MSPTLYLIIMLLGCVISIIASAIYNRINAKQVFEADIKDEIMMKAEKTVNEFLCKNNLKPGSEIHLITHALNIEIHPTDEPFDEEASFIGVSPTGHNLVRVKKNLTQREEKFALAHECGHILNKDNPPINRPTGTHKSQADQEADYIAAALLMPRKDVYDYLIEEDFPHATPRARVKIVRNLCEKYDVDDITAARRIQEVFKLAELERK